MNRLWKVILGVVLAIFLAQNAWCEEPVFEGSTYDMGQLKPFDSELKVKSGQEAPDFTLPSVSGEKVSLSQFRGKKVVLTFVPAAWTQICSQQWPGYKLVKEDFEKQNAVLIGITVDNIPTLNAWTKQMGQVWFNVLSDFWPHGAVAEKYGVLRSDGMTERALFFIDEEGIVRGTVVFDINEKPNLKTCTSGLAQMTDTDQKETGKK
jgi:peroxiredoxin (alkyl hydroperoxide reductase subunit C)